VIVYNGYLYVIYYDKIDQELPRINENAAIENGNKVRERIINTYF